MGLGGSRSPPCCTVAFGTSWSLNALPGSPRWELCIVLQPNAIRALRIGGIDGAVLSRGAAMERIEIRTDHGSRRRPRTARVVNEARRFGRVGQLENRAARGVRDLLVRLAPAPAALRSVRWLYDFEE